MFFHLAYVITQLKTSSLLPPLLFQTDIHSESPSKPMPQVEELDLTSSSGDLPKSISEESNSDSNENKNQDLSCSSQEHMYPPRGSNRFQHGPDLAPDRAYLFCLEEKERLHHFGAINFEASKPTVEIAQEEKGECLF